MRTSNRVSRTSNAARPPNQSSTQRKPRRQRDLLVGKVYASGRGTLSRCPECGGRVYGECYGCLVRERGGAS